METVETLARKLSRLGKTSERYLTRAFFATGQQVVKRAKDYAPISPTKGQINSVRKRPGKTKSQPTPAKLMRSIRIMSHNEKHVSIGVPSNSEAGDYAYKIHEEKGKSWQNRGIGTEAKGPQADDKFISRAIKDETKNIITIFERELENALRAL